MGWDSLVSTITNAAQSAAGFGSGVVSGVKGGATSLVDGVVSLGSGALSAVKATGRAAIDPAYRDQKLAEAIDLARQAADYGGRLYDDPATRREAWDTVQSAVGSIKEQYVAARDAAAAKGQLSEFYGGLVGRGGFEVAGLLVPVTKLGALGKVGAAAEGAADLQKAAKVGEALNSTKAGAAVTACAEASNAMLEVQSIARSELGVQLGRGGNKDVYAFGSSEAVGVLRTGTNAEVISEEIRMLARLRDAGIPAVNASPLIVDGVPGMLMDRFAQGSKDIVKLVDGKVRIVGESPLLNQQSIDGLIGIRTAMINNDIRINDLQFLIATDGRIAVADPLAVAFGSAPSKNNLRMIDLLIDAAKKNGPF